MLKTRVESLGFKLFVLNGSAVAQVTKVISHVGF